MIWYIYFGIFIINFSWTPCIYLYMHIFLAAIENNPDCVQLLLQHGFKVRIK